MKKFIMLALVALAATSCSSQEKKIPEIAQEKGTAQQPKPEGSWKVNKETDENGNIIRYDSIYSWSSSDAPRKFHQQDLDSLLQSFGLFSKPGFPTMEHFDFSGFSMNDSLLLQDFFEDDLFQDRFNGNMSQMNRFLEQMDSLQNEFFERHRAGFSPQNNPKQDKEGKM